MKIMSLDDFDLLEDYFSKVKLPLNEFSANQEILCETEEEWNLLYKWADKQGLKWWGTGMPISDMSLSFNRDGHGAIYFMPNFQSKGAGWSPIRNIDRDTIRFSDWVAGKTDFNVNESPKEVSRIPMESIGTNDVIWCETNEEWRELLALGEAEGIKWASGDCLTSKHTGFQRGGLQPRGYLRQATYVSGVSSNKYYILFSDWKKGGRIFETGRLPESDKLPLVVPRWDSLENSPRLIPWKLPDCDIATYKVNYGPPESTLVSNPPVSSPAKKENSMLAPFAFLSSAVSRASWSIFEWSFVSPLKKTVRPVSTITQFAICYTTLAFVGYVCYSAYSDPQAMLSWISELSPIEVKFKNAE